MNVKRQTVIRFTAEEIVRLLRAASSGTVDRPVAGHTLKAVTPAGAMRDVAELVLVLDHPKAADPAADPAEAGKEGRP